MDPALRSSAPPDAAAPLSPGAAAGLRRLVALIDSVRRQTRGWIWVEGLALLSLAVAALFWGTFAFDWAVEPPAWVRGVLLAAALLLLAWLSWRSLVGRLATPMGDAALATLVERGAPAFRDSLSTAIELAGRSDSGVDRRLLERTIDEAAGTVDRFDPRSLFRRGRLVATAVAGVLALATILGLAVAEPAVAGVWARRMLLLDDGPWPRRTHLRAEGFVDGVRKVARGSDVDLLVVADATREVPEVVDLRTRPARGGPWRTERMGLRGGRSNDGQAFGHLLKGVNEDLEVEIRGGDARVRGLRLAAVDAPALESMEVTATLPDYLGGVVRPVASSRVLAVPAGSTVDVVFHATKPLAGAVVSAVGADGAGAGEPLATLAVVPGEPPPTSIAARVGPVSAERTLVVRLTDTDGLANRDPIAVVVGAVADEPPRVAMRMRGISTAVTPAGRIPLSGTISDDHGLASAEVSLAVEGGEATRFPVTRVREGATAAEFADDAPETVTLAPLALETGKTLSLKVTARDGCTLDGGPNEGSSDAWTLSVVSPEALMAMLEAREILLRRRFESVVSDLGLVRERVAASAEGGVPAAPPDGDDGDSGAADAWSLEAGRLGESASRAAGETAEIAEAFRSIRAELDNNGLVTEELDSRLVGQIAAPLTAIATADLPALAAAARAAKPSDRDALLARTDALLARMRAVLDKMMELESYNEVIELLRGVIRTQEEIRDETIKRQRQRAKEALERP